MLPPERCSDYADYNPIVPCYYSDALLPKVMEKKMIDEIKELLQSFLAPQLEGIRGDIRAMDAKFDSVEAKITALDTNLETKFGALDTKLETKLGALEMKLETKLGALDMKLDAKVESLDAKLGALDMKLDAKVESLDSKIGSLDARVESC